MSFTRYDPARVRLQRSELAVPGSSPTMIAKAAEERGRLRLPRSRGCRRTARQGAGAQEHHPGAERHRLDGRGQDRLGAHQRPRHALHVSRRRRHHGAGRLQARHHPHSEGRRSGRRLYGRVHRQPDRGSPRASRNRIGTEALIETPLGMANVEAIARRPSRLEAMHFGVADYAAFNKARTVDHRRSQSRLSRRPVAFRAVAHDGRLPRLRPARRSTARSATSTIPMASSPPRAAPPHSASRASGRSIRRRSSSPTRCSRRRPRRSSAPSAFSSRSKEAEAQGKGAASLDGKMIDAASRRMAKNIVVMAGEIAIKKAA